MKWLEVERSKPLQGQISVAGAKNSSLALLAACCLADEQVTLNNVPNISDIDLVCKIMKEIGASVAQDNRSYVINPTGINSTYIKPEYSKAFRTAYYFIGSLLVRHKKITIGYPGGDNFVSRPIDQHIKGLEALGAKFTFYEDYYVVEAEGLTGTEIYFDCITCGATINVMLAAVLAKGKTVLYNAAKDPEVVDTAVLLNKMGAKIYGAGTDIIRINGVNELGGCVHTVVPDRLIAGAYLMAAGVTGGTLSINNVLPEQLSSCMNKLNEIGMEFTMTDNSISGNGQYKIKATRVRTGKYPMFETDFQQPITALLLKAEGRSVISDKIYPHRFNHCEQLKRMGADITVKKGVARINSYQNLVGTWVKANDIRAGISLILAGMMADKKTYITGIEHIERGYENIIEEFKSVGAKITLCKEDGSQLDKRMLI